MVAVDRRLRDKIDREVQRDMSMRLIANIDAALTDHRFEVRRPARWRCARLLGTRVLSRQGCDMQCRCQSRLALVHGEQAQCLSLVCQIFALMCGWRVQEAARMRDELRARRLARNDRWYSTPERL